MSSPKIYSGLQKSKVITGFALFFFLSLFVSPAQSTKIDSLISALKVLKEDTTKVKTLNELSWQILNTGDYVTAMQYANNAITLINSFPPTLKEENAVGSMLARSYNSIGIIYKEQGKYSEALKNYFISLKIREQVGNKKGMGNSYNNIGEVYRMQGNYIEALKNHFTALKIREEIEDKSGIADSYNNIGIIYMNQGNYTKALENYSASLKIREELGYKQGIAACFNNIGIIYKNQGKYKEALKNYSNALKIRQEIGDKLGMASSYLNIGNIHYSQGNYPEALNNQFISLKLKKEIGDQDGIAASYINIGGIKLDLKDYVDANKYLNDGLSLSMKLGNKDYIKEAYLNLSLLNSAQGDYKKAYEAYKMYTVYKDSLLNEANTKKTVQMQMQYEFDKKQAIEAAGYESEIEKQNAIAAEKSRKQKTILWSVISGLLLVMVFAGLIFRSLRITRRQNQIIKNQKSAVEKQKEIIEIKNKDITDSITYAQRIQRTLLASDNLLNKHIREHFILFKPKDIVSGDFYWATEKDEKFYLAVCDSTGHGVPGAFMSLLNISFLNEAITEKGINQPNEILNHVRKKLIENISQDGSRDGMDGILVCFDKKMNSLFYAASHNAPVLISDSIQELDKDIMPVSLSDNMNSFTNKSIAFKSGNILYLYTDGYADQFGGEKGKKFKYKQLNNLLLSISGKSMQEQKEILNSTINDWKGNLEQVDDILIIGVRL